MPVMTQQTHDQIEVNRVAIQSGLDTKVDKVSGKQLSQENFTTELKAKVDNSGNLKSDGSIVMESIYNPQNDKDIATVEYVRTSVSGASHSFVVDIRSEMLALTGVHVGDTCFVTNETTPSDNGEFIATIDDPILIDDWAERIDKASWGGILGTLSNQIDLDTRFTTNEDAITLNTAKKTNVSTNLGVTFSATEVGITSSDGTNIIIDPADGTNAGVMTSADKVILDNLNGVQASLEATSNIPAVVLNVTNGGAASTLETTYDNGTTTQVVSTIQWLASENEADWTLSNKDTGVTETMFRIINGGKATIGTGLLQHEIATVDITNDLALAITDTEKVLRYTDALGNGVLDNLTASGIYNTNDTALPNEVSGQAVVKVTEHNTTNFISQQASDYAGDNSNLMFRSSIDGGTNWTTWEDKSGALAAHNIKDKRGIDLDTLKTNGRYYTDGANRPIHSAKGVLEVFTDEVTGHTIQLTETDGDFKKYLRAFDGVSWSAWVEDNTSHVIGLAFNMIIGKANKTSLPTIYSGDSIPSNDLGKNYDRFHQYSAGTTVNEEITHGTSLENYSLHGIFLARFTDPIPASGVHTIEILPGQGRLIYIDLVHDKTLSTEELTLIIGNDSIVLEKLSNAAGSYSGFYPPSADAIIQGITDTTQYVLQAKTGHADDKEVDYEKHHGVWEREDFLNNARVNELIREYQTIIVMSLVADKKPTRAEAISAFKQLPHFNWTKNDTFYIRDSTGAKTMFCTYFADGATNEATAGKFFFKDMNECV